MGRRCARMCDVATVNWRQCVPRPPTELRKLEEEERRRARAHRRLLWERRLRLTGWLLAIIGVLFLMVLLARLTGFFPG